MSRIPLVSLDSTPGAIADFITRRGDLNVFRLLANAPEVFAGWTHWVDQLFDSPTFTARTRELIILQVATLSASRYEQHL